MSGDILLVAIVGVICMFFASMFDDDFYDDEI